jgi:hypothetical protein
MRVGVGVVGVEPTYSLRSRRNQTGPHANVCSLNANTNVRNSYFKNIYRVGGLDLERQGGAFLWDVFGCVD